MELESANMQVLCFEFLIQVQCLLISKSIHGRKNEAIISKESKKGNNKKTEAGSIENGLDKSGSA